MSEKEGTAAKHQKLLDAATCDFQVADFHGEGFQRESQRKHCCTHLITDRACD